MQTCLSEAEETGDQSPPDKTTADPQQADMQVDHCEAVQFNIKYLIFNQA